MIAPAEVDLAGLRRGGAARLGMAGTGIDEGGRGDVSVRSDVLVYTTLCSGIG